jgi:hypothetical protein
MRRKEKALAEKLRHFSFLKSSGDLAGNPARDIQCR